jgi:hypothetical protein
MDRSIAEELMQALLALDGPLNRATELTGKIADADERKAVRRVIAEVTARVYTDVIRPIVRQYPDLDPQKP